MEAYFVTRNDKTYFIPDNMVSDFDTMTDEEIEPFEITDEKWEQMKEHFPV